jgi:hypothetical protein
VDEHGGALLSTQNTVRYVGEGDAAESMPAYYFHIRDNGTLIRDPDGLELPDLDAARVECKKLILSVLREELIDEQLSANRLFQVEDEIGRTVLVVPFRMALSPVMVGRS